MLGPPARLPALDELLLAAQDAAHSLEVGGELRRGELVGDPMQLPVELIEIRAGCAHRLRRRPLVAERVLRQERDDDSAPADARAGVGLLEPGEQPQHRRLAGAVGADDADPRARLDREGEAVEHGSAAERLANGVEADERHGLAEPRIEPSTYSSRPARRASASRSSPEMPVRETITS